MEVEVGEQVSGLSSQASGVKCEASYAGSEAAGVRSLGCWLSVRGLFGVAIAFPEQP